MIPITPTDDRAKRSLIILLSIAAALGVYFVLPSDLKLGDVTLFNEMHRRVVAIFLIAAIFWATEVLPLFATSLLTIGLLILLLADNGGLAGALPTIADMPADQTISYTQFFAPFGSNIIVLFMGGFLLSAALTKHGIDRAIATRVLQPFSRNPLALIFAVLGISAFFSMWMSNTATAAMMLAIVAPIIRDLPKSDNFHRGVILAVPFGANIGGIGTPIGTPPNAVAFGAMNKAGLSIGFLDWMKIAVPLELGLLVLVGLMLYFFFKPQRRIELGTICETRKISYWGWITLAILLGAIVLWLTGGIHGIRSGGVALLAAVALTAMKVLDRTDVDSIDWNILILMWGGLALGSAISLTGFDDIIRAIPFGDLPGGAWVIAVIITFVAVMMSTFMSNTATANLLVPLTIAITVAGPQGQGEFAILTALACSFAMAMPVSTPPNAIAFATGKIPASSLLRVGGLISLISVIVMLIGYRTIIPMFIEFRELGAMPTGGG